MEEETKVNFPLTQNEVIGEGMVFSEKYEAHRKVFTEKFPNKFPENYSRIFKDTIENAKDIVADENLRKEMVSETKQFDDIAEEFYGNTVAINFCATDAFSSKSSIYSLFTIGKPNNSKNSRPKFSQKARDYAKLLRKYEKELKEAGCKEEQILAIEALAAKMDMQHWERVVSKLTRGEMTIKRTNALNEIWAGIVHIHEGSKVVFHNNPDMLALFELPKPKRKKKGPNERKKKGDTPQE